MGMNPYSQSNMSCKTLWVPYSETSYGVILTPHPSPPPSTIQPLPSLAASHPWAPNFQPLTPNPCQLHAPPYSFHLWHAPSTKH